MPVDFVTSYVDYVPNPGSDVSPVSPCVDPDMTPQLICGDVTGTLAPPGPGDSVEVNWVQLDFVGAGIGVAKALNSGTELWVRRASVGSPITNSDAATIGPNSNANADSIGVGQFGYIIEMPDGTAFDLNAWHAKSTAAAQTLTILYLPA